MNKMEKFFLKDIAESQTGPFGSQLHEEDYVVEGTPILTVEHLGEISFNLNNLPMVSDTDKARLSKYILKEGDIVFSRVGSIDRCTYVTKKEEGWLFSGRCIRVRMSEKADARYISFYFRQKYFKEMMLNISVGATMPSLNTALMDSIQLFLPSKEVQQKTALVLSTLDSKIKLNNRINSELEAMAKTLYDYWFVQFDFPDKNGKPYKTSGGKMVWNKELKREIPAGWKASRMSEWIESNKSGDWGKDEPQGNYVRKVSCIRGADINGLNGIGECSPPIRYIIDKNAFKILESHDLIIEISGGSPTQSTGRMTYITDAVIKRFENPLICSNFCKAISIKDKKMLYNFVYYWNSLYVNNVFFGYEGKTSGIKNLLFDSFVSSYWTVVPEERVVDNFYGIMQNIQAKKQTALAENQQLSELRDWLLPMLMNGQVKVV
jgi:type I restriction enzyme S subunit